MRSGRLSTPADLLELGPDLLPVVHDWLWVDVRSKEAGDVPQAAGLRNPAKVEVRAYWDERLIQGRYLRAGDRLLHITSARDFKGDRFELVMTCEELIGQPAQFLAHPGGSLQQCRVHLAYAVARPSTHIGKTEYSTQLEAALVEVGRPQPGAVFDVGGERWRVAGLVDDNDDRVVRRMWVTRL